MKRIERIYEYLIEQSNGLTIEGIRDKKGVTTTQIADSLDILRNNVSLELNKLLRQKKIIRIKGRPVYYFVRERIEKLVDVELFDEYDNLKALLSGSGAVHEPLKEESNPFDDLIGSKTSLRNQVEQAKAVIHYPPYGLHTMIVGPTGVGKTLLANMMYNYGIHIGKYEENTPFIVFNCADYYNNPQLLLSQIFGHKKGAFTGATSDKEGLFAKANGGILFLDEIHRLPPEGQEMIFYFMDTGTYSRLGDTERSEKAEVLIISATTEEPESSLLKTFVRRIPVAINIPAFDEWLVTDKIDMLKILLAMEADRVQKPIQIDAESIIALIGKTNFGNIGQLKSNVQLVCANGFLRCLHEETICISFKELSIDIKNGFFHLNRRPSEIQKINDRIEACMTILPGGIKKILLKEDYYEPDFNLYSIIEDKAMFMVDQGIPEEDINRFLKIDIDIHLNKFYTKFKRAGSSKEKILKIVNTDIFKFSEDMKVIVEERLNRKLTDRFLLAFSLHLTSFLKRIENEHKLQAVNLEHVISDMPSEYGLAVDICSHIESAFHVHVPKIETMYLSILIHSLLKDDMTEQVAVLVVAHGKSTASSMVNIVKNLLGESQVFSIDMPWELSAKKVHEQMRDMVREIDMGKGVMLLVDMGSLTGFGQLISEETGIPTHTIDMVSTPTVLEAVRKASIVDMGLDEIYSYLRNFKGYGNYEEDVEDREENEKPTAILTICSTGEGTAAKLKEFIENILVKNIGTSDITVLSVSTIEISEKIADLNTRYELLLAVGVANPNLNLPFIPLESLLLDGDDNRIIKLIQNRQHLSVTKKPRVMVLEMSEKSLNEFLTFLNPRKVIPIIHRFVEQLEKIEEKAFHDSMKISLIIHIGCALERFVLGEPLNYHKEVSSEKRGVLEQYKAASVGFQHLKLELSDDELYHLIDIIRDLLAKKEEIYS